MPFCLLMNYILWLVPVKLMVRWMRGNMLKPALARGELHCVGATTLDEYRQYIEKRCGFRASFPKVYVAEPTVKIPIAILRGLKERYELHHHVQITDPAIVAAATFVSSVIFLIVCCQIKQLT